MNSKLVKPIAVEPRDQYRIWVEFEDGIAGEVDLSDIAGKGVFKSLEDRAFFETVAILPHNSISWGGKDDLEICPDTIYIELTKAAIDSNEQRRPLPASAGTL